MSDRYQRGEFGSWRYICSFGLEQQRGDNGLEREITLQRAPTNLRAHVPRAINHHYSTIHSVTQSYVTKAFHLQAHCGNPAILIAVARYREHFSLSSTSTHLLTHTTLRHAKLNLFLSLFNAQLPLFHLKPIFAFHYSNSTNFFCSFSSFFIDASSHIFSSIIVVFVSIISSLSY